MTERPTILQVVRPDSTFQFQIIKPDQVLAPITEMWDVEVQLDIIGRLCDQLTDVISRQSRQPLAPDTKRQVTKLGKTLYRQLIPPGPEGDRLQAVLSGDCPPLLISTNVPEIPWELLHDGQDFLGLKYAMGRQLIRSKEVPIATPWEGDCMRCLLIADPGKDLPQAREEAKTLQGWLADKGIECDLLLGEEANATNILVELSSDIYNFIHYSGHVVLNQDTSIHGLVLSDGRLSPAEIERGASRNGPVVILNGCDTASVNGFADAFLKSGAQLVVGTLFDVPDLGARRWAEVFYQALISNQQAGEALRLARQTTLDDPNCSTAGLAFVMYGNPCLQLIWGDKKPQEATLLDRVLQTLGRQRQDFDNACLNVLERTLSYTGEAGGVSSAHLFTAMIEGPDSRLRDYLQARNVDTAEMQKEFEKSFRFSERFTKVMQILVDKEISLELSNSVSDILRNAWDLAQAANRPQAKFDDLLVAYSQYQDSSVYKLLREMGVDLNDIIIDLGLESPPSGEQPSPTQPRGQSNRSAISVSTVDVTTSDAEEPFRSRGMKDVAAAQDPSTATGELSPEKPSEEPRPYTVERFADVSFPASIAKVQWHPLQIQILGAKRDVGNLPFDVLMSGQQGQPARVAVCVHAPGFESMETLQRVVDVPPTDDSETIKFHLRAQGPGNYRIRVDFFQEERYLGSTLLDVEVKDGEPEFPEERAQPVGQPAIGQTGVPPDLTILITSEPLTTGHHQLKFMLHSRSPDVGLYFRDAGETALSCSPGDWLEQVLEDVVLGDEYSTGDVLELELTRLGNTLWERLIPDSFKKIYWGIRGQIRTVLIVTDDHWIPWEMMRPCRSTREGIEEDMFLCERFSLARWLRGTPALAKIPIGESRVVGAGTDQHQRFAPLASVDEEVSIVKSILSTTGTHSRSLEPSRMALSRSFEDGGFHHLHLASHGMASPKGGDLSFIVLKDGPVRPILISGKAKSFGQDHPLVFFNACETGRLGVSLTAGLGGWAERFVSVGCSAFLGTLWPVKDASAKEFAKVFYEEICQGTTLGEACRRARSHIRDSADPTWLAYSLYADPHAVLDLLGVSDGEGELLEHIYAAVVVQAFERSTERARQLRAGFIDSLLFFEALLEVDGGTVTRTLQRLSIDVQAMLDAFRRINDGRAPSTQAMPLGQQISVSQSVATILEIARHLARQAQREKISDTDVLEAYILHGQSSVTGVLSRSGLEPELLLNGAFLESGAVNNTCFSEEGRSVLEGMLFYAQRTHLVGSPQIIAALTAVEDSLARKKMKAQKIDVDAYVQALLDRASVYDDLPQPSAISLENCSARARRILNLAELLARADAVLVSEEHLFKAYVRCTQATK